MKNSLWFRGLRLWVQGLLLLCLRWAQLKTGFDPVTGLSRHSVPGLVLIAALLFCAAAEVLFLFRTPRGKYAYRNAFAPPSQKSLPVLLASGGLICAGSILLPGWSALHIAAALLGAASAAGLVLLAKMLRGNESPKVYYLLPLMFFSVVFVLVIYFPEENNPVLARYYLPVLASALAAYSLYHLAGFFRREGSLRWFVFMADLGVLLWLAALPDFFDNPGRLLVSLGYALLLTVFLLLRQADPLPEPEETEKKENSVP